jgi:glycosyltransferase involved in cell wall biosynthesis
MPLSVLINTRNRPRQLQRTLEALAHSPGNAPGEVIVIDDGGAADLAPIARELADRLPLRVERIDHAGRAAARNRGLALAAGRRILFLGDDVVAQPGLLAAHAAESDPRVAVVGPYPLARPTGSPPFRRWAEPNPQQKIEDRTDAGPFFFATGNLSMDRAFALELGGFDARFARYGWEDIDLGLRFHRAGGRLRFDPAAGALHEHPPMTRPDLWRREREMGYTAFQFAEKWRADAPDWVARMIFWDDPAALRPGPVWRRALGKGAIGLLDAIAPGSALNARLYERMVFAHRLEGVAEAWRDAGRSDSPTEPRA